MKCRHLIQVGMSPPDMECMRQKLPMRTHQWHRIFLLQSVACVRTRSIQALRFRYETLIQDLSIVLAEGGGFFPQAMRSRSAHALPICDEDICTSRSIAGNHKCAFALRTEQHIGNHTHMDIIADLPPDVHSPQAAVKVADLIQSDRFQAGRGCMRWRS